MSSNTLNKHTLYTRRDESRSLVMMHCSPGHKDRNFIKMSVCAFKTKIRELEQKCLLYFLNYSLHLTK